MRDRSFRAADTAFAFLEDATLDRVVEELQYALANQVDQEQAPIVQELISLAQHYRYVSR